ncbi:carbohydrate ABC transporter substrate-binding protein [Paenibacillus lemnae]|uniref:Carbohydrate ABC transporter substrate-binding protein n=1 Tax=Paenibacillus lemnae TaxID=1330551 RepID=A0A848M3I0_PAELE|nr:carbohydrate ABC transporter substrate-binding protein [Paenibacillus lemnae]NMO94799.1 carbohydrate ABC transporter substrate-binding protein [Paenibacillus lemnae]
MRRKNYGLLFAILLLSLTSLSPSFDVTPKVGRDLPGEIPLPPDQTPDVSRRDLGPITVGVTMNKVELAHLIKLNEQFMQKTGTVVHIIEMENIAGNNEDFMRRMQLGEGPDVILADSHWIKPFAIKGLLLPVEAAPSVIPESQLPAGLLSSMQWNGFQWGVPLDVDPYITVQRAKEPAAEPLGESVQTSDPEVISGFSIDPKDPYAFAAAVYAAGGNPEMPGQEESAALDLQQFYTQLQLEDDEAYRRRMNAEDRSDMASTRISSSSSLNRDWPEGYEITLPDPKMSSYKPVIHTRSFALTGNREQSLLALSWISDMTAGARDPLWTNITGRYPVMSGTDLNKDSAIIQLAEPSALAQLEQYLVQSSAAELNFGRADGFADYTKITLLLLNGEISLQEFTALATDESGKQEEAAAAP